MTQSLCRTPEKNPSDNEDPEGRPDSADRPDRYRSRIGAEQQREPDVLDAHGITGGKIRRGAGHAENAVIAARREPPRRDRLSKKAFGLGVDGAEALHLGHGEIGIHAAAGRREANAHPLAGREHALAHIRGTLATIVPQLLERDARNMHTQVDAIHQGPRELPAIPLDLVGKAGALAVGIAPEAAGAWVQRAIANTP